MLENRYLFRGKIVDNNEWVYGSLIVYSVTKDGKKKKYDIKLQDAYNTNLDNYRVIPETIGQFTGLTDKNGVKIFEGDVLNYDNIEGIVNFKDGSFFVRFEYLRSLHLLGELERDLEIIGNVHDA